MLQQTTHLLTETILCSNIFLYSENNAAKASNISLFKIFNIDTRKRCEICSGLTIKTSERRH